MFKLITCLFLIIGCIILLAAYPSMQSSLGITNCHAIGTAANPSVVSCGAASTGAVYCDVAASAGTCTINTTAIQTNSRVFIELNSADATEIGGGVTCNTAPTAIPVIYYASKVVGTSITLNMPTETVNGSCFDFFILN